MNIEAKKVNSANAIVKSMIETDVITKEENTILKSLAKDAKVDGFRKGKVPPSVLKAKYADKVRRDAEQSAISLLFTESLKELKLEQKDVIGEPQFIKFDRKDNGIEVEFKFSLRPTVNLDGYEDCIPKFSTPTVTKAEISQRLSELLKASAPLIDLEEKRAVKSGDFAIIDFEGFLNNVPFDGGKASAHTLEIGSNSFIPGFEDGIIGMKKDKEKDIIVTFPSEYGNEELSGKEVLFKVKVINIKVKDIPKEPTLEMLKGFIQNEENPTPQMLDDKIKEQIKNEKQSKLYNDDLKPKFVEDIIKKLNFDLPETVVEQEMDALFRNIFRNISDEDMETFKNDPKKVEEKRETYREEAEKSVKLTFIVDELAKINNIVVNDQEVMQMIYFEAMQYGQDPKKHLEYYKKQGVIPALKMGMIEDRLFATLFNKNKKGE